MLFIHIIRWFELLLQLPIDLEIEFYSIKYSIKIRTLKSKKKNCDMIKIDELEKKYY